MIHGRHRVYHTDRLASLAVSVVWMLRYTAAAAPHRGSMLDLETGRTTAVLCKGHEATTSNHIARCPKRPNQATQAVLSRNTRASTRPVPAYDDALVFHPLHAVHTTPPTTLLLGPCWACVWPRLVRAKRGLGRGRECSTSNLGSVGIHVAGHPVYVVSHTLQRDMVFALWRCCVLVCMLCVYCVYIACYSLGVY